MGVVLFRTAWVGDDAYITFRTVSNFLAGYGLRWNIDERVQSFTHPLWMFVVAAATAIVGDVYFAALAAGTIVSLLAFWLVVRHSATPAAGLAAGAALLCSKAYVDYSTSGLENPLTHLILVWYFFQYLRRTTDARTAGQIGLAASLLALNRMDALLLVAPSLLAFWFRNLDRAARRRLLFGLLPFVCWELFSLAYYGFLFPNTAYAKLGAGIPRSMLVPQGFSYLLHAVRTDPLTPTLIAVASASALVFGREQRPVGAGIALYLGYLVWIGGDFMAGRFLSAPFIISVVLVSRIPVRLGPQLAAVAIAIIVGLGFSAMMPSFLSGGDYRNGRVRADGIGDERGWYYQTTGFLRPGFTARPPQPSISFDRARRERLSVVAMDTIGIESYYAGPDFHVIDVLGLADPLLSRLPAVGTWRVGHYCRDQPDGYVASISSGSNQLADPGVAMFYTHLRTLTASQQLFSWHRMKTILLMNVGYFDSLLEPYARRQCETWGCGAALVKPDPECLDRPSWRPVAYR
jgi:arabinofuranosyltransferase